MNHLTTYPLLRALDVSPQWGATLEKQDVWVRVVPVLHWQVSVYQGGNVVHTQCETQQAAMKFLQWHGYSIEDGYLPALPA